MRGIGVQDFRHARDACGGLRGATGVVAGNEDVNVGLQLRAQLQRGGDRVQRRGFERRVVVFGDDEDGHGELFS